MEEFGRDNDDGGEMVRRWRPQRVVEVVAAVAAKSSKTSIKRIKNRCKNKSKNVITAEELNKVAEVTETMDPSMSVLLMSFRTCVRWEN